MTHVDARGDACPLPVVKAKRAISELKGAGQVEILVDNEIAVQNLTKMAQQKGYQYSAEKLAEREYRVLFTIGEAPAAEETPAVCMPDARTDTVVAIGANTMGTGAEELGKTLLKAFVFALTQQDKLPKTVLFYNGGASLTCEGSPMLEDLKTLDDQIHFGELPTGCYTYMVIVTETSGETLCFASDFTVSDAATSTAIYWSVQDPDGTKLTDQTITATAEETIQSTLGWLSGLFG